MHVKLPAFLEEDNPASANEVWLRLHSDPLFAVRTPDCSCSSSCCFRGSAVT